MIKYWFLTIAVLLISQSTDEYRPFNFVIWNVGQGSWSTFIDGDSCLHFDMGGEKISFSKVEDLCAKKYNAIYLTHLDWDHISFIKKFLNSTERVCLFYPKKKKRWMESIAICNPPEQDVRILSYGIDNADSNSSSIVYLVKEQILISGDAPMSEERKWYKKVPQGIRVLLLGHHGSYTSSGVELLNWVQPQMAVVSARKAKYGHPHWRVTRKLKKTGIPLLRTEAQGDIKIQISDI